ISRGPPTRTSPRRSVCRWPRSRRTSIADAKRCAASWERTMSFDDLERRVHEELRRLPAPLAPSTLLPRVLAAVDAWARRPWYERAWFTWPLGWQIVSAAALALAVYGTWNLPPLPAS